LRWLQRAGSSPAPGTITSYLPYSVSIRFSQSVREPARFVPPIRRFHAPHPMGCLRQFNFAPGKIVKSRPDTNLLALART